jgi:hypothetical protein
VQFRVRLLCLFLLVGFWALPGVVVITLAAALTRGREVPGCAYYSHYSCVYFAALECTNRLCFTLRSETGCSRLVE